MSPQIHPNGFRISDRPVAASFAHPYSFQPVTDFLSRDDACLSSSMSLGGAEGTWVRYWDESSTAAVLEFEVDEVAQPATSSAKDKDQDKDKEKKKKAKGNKPLHFVASSFTLIFDEVRSRMGQLLRQHSPFLTNR